MSRTHLKVLTLALAMVVFIAPVAGQSKKKQPRTSQEPLARQIEATRAEVINKSNEYKESLGKLLALVENEILGAAGVVENRRALFNQGIIAKRELEESEKKLADLQTKAEETRRQMVEADNLIAEVKAAEQLDKLAPAAPGAYTATAALIRYNGQALWAVSDVVKVESFFISRFGRTLPVSALGQTAVHDRMGFDHRNSIDVAVHPDSAEGRAVMAYLRSAGIPFIAFRSAVPGTATGAHIHIGYPSRRLAR